MHSTTRVLGGYMGYPQHDAESDATSGDAATPRTKPRRELAQRAEIGLTRPSSFALLQMTSSQSLPQGARTNVRGSPLRQHTSPSGPYRNPPPRSRIRYGVCRWDERAAIECLVPRAHLLSGGCMKTFATIVMALLLIGAAAAADMSGRGIRAASLHATFGLHLDGANSGPTYAWWAASIGKGFGGPDPMQWVVSMTDDRTPYLMQGNMQSYVVPGAPVSWGNGWAGQPNK